MSLPKNTKRNFTTALPIVLGYIAIGLPCGILAASIGWTWWQALIVSILFYSGAGQFMIPNMFLAGLPLSSIIASVSFVNMRQMLYSASLAPFCKGESKPLSFIFAATVTDESYGVNVEKLKEDDFDVRDALSVNLMSRASWSISNAVGVVIGDAVGIPLAIASFAMTSIFICLLVSRKWNRDAVVAAICAAVGVFVCKAVGLTGPAILIGAVFGVVCALVVSSVLPRRPVGKADGVDEAGDEA